MLMLVITCRWMVKKLQLFCLEILNVEGMENQKDNNKVPRRLLSVMYTGTKVCEN